MDWEKKYKLLREKAIVVGMRLAIVRSQIDLDKMKTSPGSTNLNAYLLVRRMSQIYNDGVSNIQRTRQALYNNLTLEEKALVDRIKKEDPELFKERAGTVGAQLAPLPFKDGD